MVCCAITEHFLFVFSNVLLLYCIVVVLLYCTYCITFLVQVLRGLSLRVRAGETIALVGGSGCGKSTLLQLLQRLYEPESGNITVDGHQLQALDLHHFRSRIGML